MTVLRKASYGRAALFVIELMALFEVTVAVAVAVTGALALTFTRGAKVVDTLVLSGATVSWTSCLATGVCASSASVSVWIASDFTDSATE